MIYKKERNEKIYVYVKVISFSSERKKCHNWGCLSMYKSYTDVAYTLLRVLAQGPRSHLKSEGARAGGIFFEQFFIAIFGVLLNEAI